MGWFGTQRLYTKGLIHTKSGSDYLTIQKKGKTIEQRINNFFVKFGNYVAIGMCLRFAEAAAKFTPPNMGKANIEQKYYSRPIYKLDDLAKGLVRTERGKRLYATKEDYAALRSGYKFKIMNTKYRVKRGTVFAYAKGINEAKRLARIERRGLSKYSWGSMINNTNQDVKKQLDKDKNASTIEVFSVNKLPPIFQRLARKSPAITKYVWGSYDWDFKPTPQKVDRIQFAIENRLAQIQTYGRIAIQQGSNAASKYANTLWKGIDALVHDEGSNLTNYMNEDKIAVTDLRKSLTKMFRDTQERYQINQIVLNKTDAIPEGQIFIRRSK